MLKLKIKNTRKLRKILISPEMQNNAKKKLKPSQIWKFGSMIWSLTFDQVLLWLLHSQYPAVQLLHYFSSISIFDHIISIKWWVHESKTAWKSYAININLYTCNSNNFNYLDCKIQPSDFNDFSPKGKTDEASLNRDRTRV